MAKFTQQSSKPNVTQNHEGQTAWKLGDKETLVHLASTCLMNEPKFYGEVGDTEKHIQHLAEKIAKNDPFFIAQLAVYLRHAYYLRSVPMFLLSVLAHEVPRVEFGGFTAKGYGNFYGVSYKHLVRKAIPMTIGRADEIYELLAAYLNTYGKPIPNCLKKGINDSFPKFDEYSMSKYNRKQNHPNFQDVMRLTHPRQPKHILKGLMNGTLETPYTWETVLSSEDGRSKEEKWKELVMSGKMGYMGSIRNCRNVLDNVRDKDVIKTLTNRISDEFQIKRSKQFPFRFWSAYNELSDHGNPYTKSVRSALSKALDISFSNVPHMNGVTAIFCDISASMHSTVSERSKVRMYDIGILLGLGAHGYTDGCIFGAFGRDFAVLQPNGESVLPNMPDCMDLGMRLGCATNGHLAIDYLIEQREHVDRILLFSDMQLWKSEDYLYHVCGQAASLKDSYNRYKNINPDVKMYLFDLSGYGTVQIPPHDKSVVTVSGWSEKIFKYINATEGSMESQVKEIENYKRPDHEPKHRRKHLEG